MTRCSRAAAAVLLAALLWPAAGRAHGGFPLRLGVSGEPGLSALSQVVVVALREGQGMSVERQLYPDRAALLRAWSAREIDFLVDLPAEEARRAAGLTEAACGDGVETRVGEAYRNGDGPAAVEFFALSLTGSACGRPGVVVRRSVADNLRYSTVRQALRRAAAAVQREDLDRLLVAGAAGERALVQAVRELLDRKGAR